MMNAKQINELALRAIYIMMEVPDDSFALTNAVRALPEWDSMTPDERTAVNERGLALIKSGDY